MGDPFADKKFKKTKKIGKEDGDKKEEDQYNFYGDYDLTPYFEKESEN